MRYIRVRVRARDGGLHPWGQQLTEEPSVTRGPIHRLTMLGDGTAVLLAEMDGDIDRYREITAANEYVNSVSIAGENPAYVYAHFELTDIGAAILKRIRQIELVLQTPIRVEDTGAMVGTLIGEETQFEDFATGLPEDVSIEVVEIGAYNPELDDVFSSLTSRQQEVLRAAVDLGYFEIPREATCEDIADRVDVSAGTVGEHLRKIERQVFTQFVR
jgi:hypothetical protein